MLCSCLHSHFAFLEMLIPHKGTQNTSFTSHSYSQAVLMHCSYDMILKVMHRNLYDIIVEPVHQVKATVKYKKPQGPCQDGGWDGG